LPYKLLAVTAVVVAALGMEAARSAGAIEAAITKIVCDKVASPLGSNGYSGTVAKPYLTVDKLASSLRSGQTGCLRAGVYQRDVEIKKGGSNGAPMTITSFPGERATILGRVYLTDQANNVVLQQLDLDGYNHARLPSPTVNGDNVVFRDNDVTNRHTSICFLLGSREWGRARGAVIERNRIHNCGQLPPTNHHHGIYAEATDNARITDNWIYDNADRGVQMFPDAQRTYVARNVIDGNGEGVVFSRTSANNVVEKNIISNPVVRYTLEDFELTGKGNVARRNCLWSTRHAGNPGGLPAALAVPAVESIFVDPGFLNRAAKDFRLVPWSPCINFPLIPATAPVATRKKLKRPVRLSATRLVVYPGGRVRLRAQIPADSAQSAPKRALLKMRRDGLWRRVEVMRRSNTFYETTVGLEKRKGWRRFGKARVWSGRRTLRLRASVKGVGLSNLVVLRLGE
jgi:nitrous oxidase accessory protein NosD